MADIERFSALVGDIYDASLDPGLWPTVFEQVCEYARGAAVHLNTHDCARKTSNNFFSWGGNPNFSRLYFEKYAKLNPMFPSLIFYNVEELHQLVDFMPREEVCASRFGREWLRPQGYVDDLSCVIDKSATSCAVLTVVRHISVGFVDDEMRRCMALLVPHIRRAVLIGKVIDLHKVEAAALADTLDTLASSLFLADANGRIVHANTSGHAQLAQGDVLRVSGGRLIALDPEANKALHGVFTTSADGDTALGRKGIAVPLKSRDGGRYVAHALPLTAGARRKAGTSYAAVAAVFVRKAELDTPSPLEAVTQTFRLTPAELRVLIAIVEIGGVPEVAPVLGIAEATVKAHLRSVYDKTGAKRQADLVKLVAGYTNPLLIQPKTSG